MKKWTFLMVCLVLATVLLTGCSEADAPFAEKSYTPEDTVTGIHLDVRDRQVEVLSSEDGQIHIDYYESSEEGYEIAISQDHILTMTAKSQKEWTDFIGAKAPAAVRRITLQLPQALLDQLWISTTNGDIRLSPLTVNGDVALRTNGGSIGIDRLSAGTEITLDVKNGNLSGTISGSYDAYAITCSVKKGDSNLPAAKEGGPKSLTVTANNGDVQLEIQK